MDPVDRLSDIDGDVIRGRDVIGDLDSVPEALSSIGAQGVEDISSSLFENLPSHRLRLGSLPSPSRDKDGSRGCRPAGCDLIAQRLF